MEPKVLWRYSMSRLTLLVVAVLGACLVLAGTAYADETETPTPEPEPSVVETAVAPDTGETPVPIAETPAPDEETPLPVDETPRPLAPTPTTDGATRYEVTVGFNTSVTQDDIDEVGALLRAYDDELEYVVMESWPPIGQALLTTDVADFCQTVEAELEAKSYIDDVSCGPVEPAPVDEPAGDEGEVIAPAPDEEQVIAPAPDEEQVIAPAPDEEPLIAPAPGTPESLIAPPRSGAGSPSGGSWPWWPLAVAAGAAVGAAGVLLAYQGRRAKS
jgi:hypothetical protein